MLCTQSIGGGFVHAHMLNEQSRKYFTRAFATSGSVSSWLLRKDDHVKQIQWCLRIKKTGNELVEYLKTANISTLFKCKFFPGAVFIESPNTPGAFISETPAEIYNSGKAPAMDAMFGFTSQVIQPRLSPFHFLLY